MACAECVVDVRIRERGEAGGQLGIVRRLPGVETEVLQQHDLFVRRVVDELRDAVPDHLVGHTNLAFEQLCQPSTHRLHRKLGLECALGAA